MIYRIEYLATVIADDLAELPKAIKTEIRKAIEKKLITHPIEFGKPLRYSLKGARRLRVGDYRVIYRIESANVVLIIKIGHRKEVYDE